MGRIQSNVGLITGVPIGDTVDKLMQIESRPRDNLQEVNTKIDKERAAITELSALLMAVQYPVKNLGKVAVFDKRTATSSNDAALGVRVTGSPTLGSYIFTPLRTVQPEQWLSKGVREQTEPLGAGTLSFRFGPGVDRSLDLDLLRGGQGFQRGLIRITDRSGASAEIDLTTVQTLEDVINAINSNTRINVRAEVVGDHIRLTDLTGSSVANLRVQDIGGGQAAASLGLAGIDTASSVADGQDIVWLSSDTLLSELNDGLGISASSTLPDISFQLRDGTTGVIDFDPLPPSGQSRQTERTLGDIVNTINNAAPGKLQAEISADGKRLVLRDLTSGSGQFSLSALYGSQALKELGLDVAANGDTITGRRLIGSLKSPALSQLNGGQGLGDLGTIQITDRAGNQATVDLSAAETLEDVIRAINAAGIGVRAAVNGARNGLVIEDISGGTGNLKIETLDSSQTAEKLNIAVDDAVSVKNSGDLHLRVISVNTKLSELNGGRGVTLGRFTVTDSKGVTTTVDLAAIGAQTIGDVLAAINRGAANVNATINATGDGILIRDLANGTGTLVVNDLNGTAAADLGILKQSTLQDFSGQSAYAIDGSLTYKVTLEANDSLQTLRDKINALNAGVRATIIYDGSNRPYRLSLVSERGGHLAQMIVDEGSLDLGLTRFAEARDAQLAIGQAGTPGAVVLSSSSNKFSNVVPGLELEVKQSSSTPVSVQVTTTDTDLVASVQAFVDNYNKFWKRYQELTKYDTTTQKGEILAQDPTAIRLGSEISYILSSRFPGAGNIQSLAEIGVSIKDDGTLDFDSSKLKQKFADDPDAVKKFFTDKTFGFAAKFDKLAESLVGQDVSLMAQRFIALTRKYEENQQRIEWWNAKLDRRKEQLLLYFYRLESAIAKIKGNIDIVSQIQPIPMYFASGGRNNR